MNKKQIEIWEIIIETLTAVAVFIFLGLQLYYRYAYESSLLTILYHILPVILIYIGMTILQMFPELLNGSKSEKLYGKVRTYAIRMVRNGKFLLVLGMLVPSAADALGIAVNAAYSLLIMGGILGNIGYYIYRIYAYNSSQKGE